MNIIKKHFRNNWQLYLLVLLAMLVRFYFLDKYLNVSGDLLLQADWGEKYWTYGSRDFYFIKDWYYARPNYPPLTIYYYAYANKLYDYKYLMAALHNVIKIPPADFIIYYYKWGYFINLKLLGIVSDILAGIFIYREVLSYLKNKKYAVFAAGIFLLNPITIILSSVWGQIDSTVALLSIMAFYLVVKKKFVLSGLLFTVGLLLKPNWIIFLPLYLIVFLINRPKLRSVLITLMLTAFFIFVIAIPFSNNPPDFYTWFIKDRILTTLFASPHASISAFNFYTTFLKIDYHLSSHTLLFIPVKYIGYLIFALIYLKSLLSIIKNSGKIGVYKAVITIGLGSFLFMPGMLERYFFPMLIPFSILAFKSRKLLWVYLIYTVLLSLNVVWALFRRKYGDVDALFTGHNFFLIKSVSIINVVLYIYLLRSLFNENLLKLVRYKVHHTFSSRGLRMPVG